MGNAEDGGSDVPEDIVRNDPPAKKARYNMFMDRFLISAASAASAAKERRASVASASQSIGAATRAATLAHEKSMEANSLTNPEGIAVSKTSSRFAVSKADAIAAVGRILEGETAHFELVEAREFHRLGNRTLKTPSWLQGFECQWEYLCFTGHRSQHSGYVICPICCSSIKNDAWKDGVLTVGPTGDKNSLNRLAKGHSTSSQHGPKNTPTAKMTNALAKAPVLALVLDFQSYGWMQGRGARESVLALLQAGQRFPSNFHFDLDFVSDLLPSRDSVTRELSRITREIRMDEAKSILTWFQYGGGGSTDGWKSNVNGKTYYDLTVYFVSYEEPEKTHPGADAKAHLHQRVLFHTEHTQTGSSAAEIKLTLETALQKQYSASLADILRNNFTSTTDWAAVMARCSEVKLRYREPYPPAPL